MKHQLLRLSQYLIMLTVGSTVTVFARSYDSGFEALQANKQKEALDIWSPLANQGNADAQFGMGVLYYSGGEIEQNPKRAIEWFQKAAEQGHAGAQFNLGNEYKRGAAMLSQDDSKAAYWWKKAAQKGLLQAQYNLGMAYYFGSGVKQDRSKAMFWFKMAADNRYEPALKLIKKLQNEAKHTTNSAKAAIAPPPVVKKSKPKSPQMVFSNESLAFREQWILTQPESNYTIQLFGSGNETQVKEYINTHQLPGKTAYFFSRREGKPWYSLVYGSFTNAQQARSKVSANPTLFQSSPWIRQYKGIQEAIKKRR